MITVKNTKGKYKLINARPETVKLIKELHKNAKDVNKIDILHKAVEAYYNSQNAIKQGIDLCIVYLLYNMLYLYIRINKHNSITKNKLK